MPDLTPPPPPKLGLRERGKLEKRRRIKAAARAVFLEKGAVRFDGAPDELLRRGDLARAVFLGGRR